MSNVLGISNSNILYILSNERIAYNFITIYDIKLTWLKVETSTAKAVINQSHLAC